MGRRVECLLLDGPLFKSFHEDFESGPKRSGGRGSTKMRQFRRFLQQIRTLVMDISKLQQDVAKQKSLNTSVIALLVAHTAALKDLSSKAQGTDLQPQIDQMASDLEANQAELVAAVTENTPAENIADHVVPTTTNSAAVADEVQSAAEAAGATESPPTGQ